MWMRLLSQSKLLPTLYPHFTFHLQKYSFSYKTKDDMVGSPQVGGPFPVDGIIMIFIFLFFYIMGDQISFFLHGGVIFTNLFS